MNLTTLSDLTRYALALASETGFSVEVEAADGTRLILQRRHAQRTLVVLLGTGRASAHPATLPDESLNFGPIATARHRR